MQIRFGSFCAKLLTDRQTNSADYILLGGGNKEEKLKQKRYAQQSRVRGVSPEGGKDSMVARMRETGIYE